MFDTEMLVAAALMLLGAFVVTGAWLIRRRGVRMGVVLVGAAIFTGGVVTLTGALA